MKLHLNIPFQSLSSTELIILQYIHEHSNDVAYMSIQALADKLHYSTSTVLRFCRKLGYSGFSEFKYALRTQHFTEDPLPNSSPRSIDAIKQSIITDLESTSSLLDTDNLYQIARLLSSGKSIYLHNPSGMTAITVDYFESMLFISGLQKVYKSAAPKTTRHFIQTVEQGSIFVFISNSGRFETTLNLAKEARLHGMIVISISSIENNNLAEVSNYSLRLFSKSRENNGADLASRLCSFFVLSSCIEYFSIYKEKDLQ